jgi:hypothetical protein
MQVRGDGRNVVPFIKGKIMAKCDCFLCFGLYGHEEDDCINIDAEHPDERHKHTPKEYVGFTEKYTYCEECNERLDQ